MWRLIVELHAALSADPGQVAVARRLVPATFASRVDAGRQRSPSCSSASW